MHAFYPQKKTQKANSFRNYIDDPKKKRKELVSDDRTIWTVCPYCYYLYEYDEVYEDCCLMCQNCRRPFHGVAVAPPPVGVMVEGNEQYYCGIGCFPLKYNLESCLGDKKGENGNDDSFLGEKKRGKRGFETDLENVVLISDDSDDECRSREKTEDKNGKNYDVGIKGETLKNEEERVKVNIRVDETAHVVQGSVRSEVKKDGNLNMKKNVKSVARNTKKVMGRGKSVKLESSRNPATRKAEFGPENGSGEGSFGSEDDLVFSLRDDDIYVGLGSM